MAFKTKADGMTFKTKAGCMAFKTKAGGGYSFAIFGWIKAIWSNKGAPVKGLETRRVAGRVPVDTKQLQDECR